MLLGDVVDEFLNDDGLADAGATEQADLAALEEGLDEIDDLDAGFKHLGAGGLLIEGRRKAMDRHALLRVDGSEVVDRLADDVHHAAQRLLAHGNADGTTQIDGFHAAHHALGGLHGDATDAAFAEVLLHFENDVDGLGNREAVADHAKGGVDERNGRFGELHVHGGTGDLNDVSDIFRHMCEPCFK